MNRHLSRIRHLVTGPNPETRLGDVALLLRKHDEKEFLLSYAQEHLGDALGRLLWEMVQPFPWEKAGPLREAEGCIEMATWAGICRINTLTVMDTFFDYHPLNTMFRLRS